MRAYEAAETETFNQKSCRSKPAPDWQWRHVACVAGKLKTVKEGGRDVFLIEEQKQLYETFVSAKRDIPNMQREINSAEEKPAEYLKVPDPPTFSMIAHPEHPVS
ncbi:MAG: hypothetical protein HC767_14700 [Akkermansiaceae bacterium]|nr:hypothetical protein [Akkermansiaceae bacterium]